MGRNITKNYSTERDEIVVTQDANGVWSVELNTLNNGKLQLITGTLQRCLRACRTYEPETFVSWVAWADAASTRRINAN